MNDAYLCVPLAVIAIIACGRWHSLVRAKRRQEKVNEAYKARIELLPVLRRILNWSDEQYAGSTFLVGFDRHTREADVRELADLLVASRSVKP